MKIKYFVATAVLATAILCLGAGINAQTAPWCHTFNTNISLGAGNGYLNDEVAALKIALTTAGAGGSAMNSEKGFGQATLSAVKSFQKTNGIPQSGSVDSPTRAKLNSLYGCPSITVTSPNNGTEVWKVGTTQNITWSSSRVDMVAIYFYDYDPAATSSVKIIATSVNASNGKYPWNITSDFVSSKAKIYILNQATTSSSNAVGDFSDNYFSVTGATTPPAPCIDTDGGKNYFVKGTATDKYGTYTDLCYAATNQVFEYYCDPTLGYSQSVWYTCPNGCADGACNKVTSDLNNQNQTLASIYDALAQIMAEIKTLLGQ